MSGGNHTTAHTMLIARARLALGREPDLVLWLNRSEHVERWDSTRGGAAHSQSGLPKGSADLVGVLRMNLHLGIRPVQIGRWISLEGKTGRGEPNDDQRKHIELVRSLGGFAAVFHTPEEAVAAIARARRGESS